MLQKENNYFSLFRILMIMEINFIFKISLKKFFVVRSYQNYNFNQIITTSVVVFLYNDNLSKKCLFTWDFAPLKL